MADGRLAIVALALACFAAGTAAALADPAAGRSLAAQKCQPCHGMDGVAAIPEAPNLSGQNRSYLARQLWAFRSRERSDQQMSPVAATLSDEEIVHLADWYSSIRITVEAPE